MPKNGVMASGSMHTPTTTTRLWVGMLRSTSSRIPGTPTASKATTARPRPSLRQVSHTSVVAGSTTAVAPMVVARARRAGERSLATTASTPWRRRAATTARPTGPQPSTTAPSPAPIPERFTAWSPTAMGSVRAAPRASSPLGTVSASGAESTMRSL